MYIEQSFEKYYIVDVWIFLRNPVDLKKKKLWYAQETRVAWKTLHCRRLGLPKMMSGSSKNSQKSLAIQIPRQQMTTELILEKSYIVDVRVFQKFSKVARYSNSYLEMTTELILEKSYFVDVRVFQKFSKVACYSNSNLEMTTELILEKSYIVDVRVFLWNPVDEHEGQHRGNIADKDKEPKVVHIFLRHSQIHREYCQFFFSQVRSLVILNRKLSSELTFENIRSLSMFFFITAKYTINTAKICM